MHEMNQNETEIDMNDRLIVGTKAFRYCAYHIPELQPWHSHDQRH